MIDSFVGLLKSFILSKQTEIIFEGYTEFMLNR